MSTTSTDGPSHPSVIQPVTKQGSYLKQLYKAPVANSSVPRQGYYDSYPSFQNNMMCYNPTFVNPTTQVLYAATDVTNYIAYPPPPPVQPVMCVKTMQGYIPIPYNTKLLTNNVQPTNVIQPSVTTLSVPINSNRGSSKSIEINTQEKGTTVHNKSTKSSSSQLDCTASKKFDNSNEAIDLTTSDIESNIDEPRSSATDSTSKGKSTSTVPLQKKAIQKDTITDGTTTTRHGTDNDSKNKTTPTANQSIENKIIKEITSQENKCNNQINGSYIIDLTADDNENENTNTDSNAKSNNVRNKDVAVQKQHLDNCVRIIMSTSAKSVSTTPSIASHSAPLQGNETVPSSSSQRIPRKNNENRNTPKASSPQHSMANECNAKTTVKPKNTVKPKSDDTLSPIPNKRKQNDQSVPLEVNESISSSHKQKDSSDNAKINKEKDAMRNNKQQTHTQITNQVKLNDQSVLLELKQSINKEKEAMRSNMQQSHTQITNQVKLNDQSVPLELKQSISSSYKQKDSSVNDKINKEKDAMRSNKHQSYTQLTNQVKLNDQSVPLELKQSIVSSFKQKDSSVNDKINKEKDAMRSNKHQSYTQLTNQVKLNDQSVPLELKQSIVSSFKQKDSSDNVVINKEKYAVRDINIQNNTRKKSEIRTLTEVKVLNSNSVNEKQDSDELVLPLLPHVAAFSRAMENKNVNMNEEDLPLPLPLKGFDLASFSREQIMSLPIAFTYVPNDIESEHRAKIAQANFLNRKRMDPSSINCDSVTKQSRVSLPSQSLRGDNSSSNKKAKTHEILYTGPAPGYPSGWILLEKKRLNGACKGGKDRWWFSPKTGKKFRSSVETRKFREYLEKTDGNEDEAYRIFKQYKR